VVKNKLAPPFGEAEFDIIYGQGISREGDIVDLAVANKIIEKTGTWFAYKEEKLAQGRDNVVKYLKENPKLANELEGKVRQALNIPVPAPSQEKEKLAESKKASK